MIMTTLSVEMWGLPHGIAWWYVQFNPSERSKTGTDCTCQIPSWLALVFHSSPQDVPNLLLHRVAIRSRANAQPLLDPFIKIAHGYAGQF